jgi:DNA-binding IclR family transcriptional regulator
MTENTITTAADLRRACSAIRKQGWALCNEELHLGVVGCGVRLPLKSSSGFIGLCVSAPATRMNLKTITTLMPLLRKVAEDIANTFDQRASLPADAA